MAEMDYVKIIDDFNDQAFKYCVDLLYPSLKFRILTKQDIRKVDLKERVLEIIAGYLPVKDNKPSGSLEKYVEAVKFYFDNYLHCKPDSIALRYHAAALDAMKEIKAGNGELSRVEDVFMVFIALMRSAAPDFSKKTPIENVDFVVKESDGVLLEQIRDYPFAFPTPPLAIVALQFLTDKQKGIPDYRQPMAQKELLYINNILLYCRMMQAQGEFAEGDGVGGQVS